MFCLVDFDVKLFRDLLLSKLTNALPAVSILEFMISFDKRSISKTINNGLYSIYKHLDAPIQYNNIV